MVCPLSLFDFFFVETECRLEDQPQQEREQEQEWEQQLVQHYDSCIDFYAKGNSIAGNVGDSGIRKRCDQQQQQQQQQADVPLSGRPFVCMSWRVLLLLSCGCSVLAQFFIPSTWGK
ncbi:hypothetical protein AWZ03_013961 [Drosophila navojoa]|uniref:Uncharacterized protein n=1 Tax=Drosophila navojoa TaxID=7232 RepID=A0A484ASH2_DRONA|nr:hypothetical protein AWZ03_013961 [Drosophila navojoa]